MPVIFTDQRAAIQIYHESTNERREKNENKWQKQKDTGLIKNENYNSPRMVKLRKNKKKEGVEEVSKENGLEAKPAESAVAADAKLKLMALDVDQLAEASSTKTNREIEMTQ